jgi:hypothetical protein
MDTKTLALASIELTEARLEQFLSYQRVLLEELGRTGSGDGWSGRFAFAHQHALAHAGLDVITYEKVRAQVGDFHARASTLALVHQRLAAARQKVAAASSEGAATDPADARLLDRAGKELPALEDWSDFRARYGAAALSLLQQRADEVARLHQLVAVAEGCPKAFKGT